MNVLRHQCIIAALVVFPAQALFAQGTFQNLDFESANVAGYSRGDLNVPISRALPDWEGIVTTPTSTNSKSLVVV